MTRDELERFAVKDILGAPVFPGDIFFTNGYQCLWGPLLFVGVGRGFRSVQYACLGHHITPETSKVYKRYFTLIHSSKLLKVPEYIIADSYISNKNRIIEILNMENLMKNYEKIITTYSHSIQRIN